MDQEKLSADNVEIKGEQPDYAGAVASLKTVDQIKGFYDFAFKNEGDIAWKTYGEDWGMAFEDKANTKAGIEEALQNAPEETRALWREANLPDIKI